MDYKNIIAIVALVIIVTLITLLVVLIRFLVAQVKRATKLQDQMSEYLAQKIDEGKKQGKE